MPFPLSPFFRGRRQGRQPLSMKLVKASVLHHLWKAHFVTGSIRNLGQLARLHCTSRCGLPAVGSVGMKMPTVWCS